MKGKTFVDTNILIYSLDNNYPDKQKISRKKLSMLGKSKTGVISTQVMQEFYVITTKKYKRDQIKIKNLLKFYENYEIVQISVNLIHEAIDISILNQLSFWDSLIISAAVQAKCSSILTEDMNHGQIINGLRIINPFVENNINL